MSDLALFEVDPETADRSGDVREVANYVKAATHVLDPGRRLPIRPLDAIEILDALATVPTPRGATLG